MKRQYFVIDSLLRGFWVSNDIFNATKQDLLMLKKVGSKFKR